MLDALGSADQHHRAQWMAGDMHGLPSVRAGEGAHPGLQVPRRRRHRGCVRKSRDVVELLTDRRPELAARDYSHLLLTGALPPHTTRARFDTASVLHGPLLL